VTEKLDFRPFEPRRLVPAGPHAPPLGAAAVFPVGTLVDEADGPGGPPGGPKVLQLAARRR
jgi:hypothetical protein